MQASKITYIVLEKRWNGRERSDQGCDIRLVKIKNPRNPVIF